jgi:hypothetical protein
MCVETATAALIMSGIGAATAAAGTAMNAQQQASFAQQTNAARKEQELASEKARAAESDRQQTFADKAMENWQSQLDAQGAKTYTDVASQGTQDVLDTTGKIAASPTPGLAEGMLPGMTSPNVSKVFTDEVARQGAIRGDEAKNRIAALATLAGYDRAGGYERVSGDRFKADQGLLWGQARQSLALGQQEGNTATPYVAPPDTGLTKALTGLGGLAMQYGAYKSNVNPDAVANLKAAAGTAGSTNIFGL